MLRSEALSAAHRATRSTFTYMNDSVPQIDCFLCEYVCFWLPITSMSILAPGRMFIVVTVIQTNRLEIEPSSLQRPAADGHETFGYDSEIGPPGCSGSQL